MKNLMIIVLILFPIAVFAQKPSQLPNPVITVNAEDGSVVVDQPIPNKISNTSLANEKNKLLILTDNLKRFQNNRNSVQNEISDTQDDIDAENNLIAKMLDAGAS